jgi:hypothetical protein
MCVAGLGNIYGNHELKDVMDRHAELRIIESTLWKHFERLESVILYKSSINIIVILYL